jgi:hypothetical protein
MNFIEGKKLPSKNENAKQNKNVKKLADVNK